MNGLTDNLLFSFFSVSFIAGLIMLLVPARNRFLPQKTAFFLSVPVVVLAAVSYILFLLGEHPGLFSASVPLVSSLGLNICLGADNLSMVFIFFSALFVPVSILVSRHAKRMSSFFYSLPFSLNDNGPFYVFP